MTWPSSMPPEPLQILITGIPKSGTTALHFKIWKTLPTPRLSLFERLPYSAEELQHLPLSEQAEVNILAKTLIADDGLLKSYDHFNRKILLVRDPRDNLVSCFLYTVLHSSIVEEPEKLTVFLSALREKERNPQSIPFLALMQLRDELAGESFLERMNLWREQSLHWHDRNPNAFVFSYDTLVRKDFSALEDFIGFTVGANTPVQNAHQRVVRTKGSGDWKNWLLPEDCDVIAPLVSPYMQRYNFGDDWQPAKTPIIPPEHSTKYLLDIVTNKVR